MSDNVFQNEKSKWLLVALIYADFTDPTAEKGSDIFAGINAMLDDFLITTLNPDKCRISVLLDSISFSNDTDRNFVRNLIANYEVGKASGSIFNEIKQCTVLFDEVFDTRTLAESGDSNSNRHKFQRPYSLACVLNTVPINADEQVLFITWDHGAGFGIFPDKFRTTLSPSTEPISFQDRLSTNVALKCFWDISVAEDVLQSPFSTTLPDDPAPGPEILENSELAEALGIWMESNSKPFVDVLLMTNCWMMNYHTMYALKDIVKCFVSSQSMISIPAYNYAGVIRKINTSINVPVDHEVCTSCIESRGDKKFVEKVEALGLTKEEVIEDCVILAIDLMAKDNGGNRYLDIKLAALKQFIQELNDVMQKNPDDESTTLIIRTSRATSYDFETARIFLIDFDNFMSHLGFIKELISPQLIKLKEYIAEYIDIPCPDPSVICGKGNAIPYPVNRTCMVPKPTGYSLFFRTKGMESVEDKVKYCVERDSLLNNFLPEWKNVLRLLFGE